MDNQRIHNSTLKDYNLYVYAHNFLPYGIAMAIETTHLLQSYLAGGLNRDELISLQVFIHNTENWGKTMLPSMREPRRTGLVLAHSCCYFQGAKEAGQSPHDGPASGYFQCILSGIDILIIALKICFCYKDHIDGLSGAGWSMLHNLS